MPTVPMLAELRMYEYWRRPIYDMPTATAWSQQFIERHYTGNKHCLRYQVLTTTLPQTLVPDEVAFPTRNQARGILITDDPARINAYFYETPEIIPAEPVLPLGFDAWPPLMPTGAWALENQCYGIVMVHMPDDIGIIEGRAIYWIPNIYVDESDNPWNGYLVLRHLNESFGLAGVALDYWNGHDSGVSIEVIQEGDGTLTLNFTFDGIRSKWDGAEIHAGINQLEIKVDGEILSVSLAHEINTSYGSLAVRHKSYPGPDAESYEYIPGVGWGYLPPESVHTATTEIHRYTGSINIPWTTDLALRRGNEYGDRTSWLPLYYVPEVSFTAEIIEDVLNVDAGASRALGATIAQDETVPVEDRGYMLDIRLGGYSDSNPYHQHQVPTQTFDPIPNLEYQTSPVFSVNFEDTILSQSHLDPIDQPHAGVTDGDILYLTVWVKTDRGCEASSQQAVVYSDTGNISIVSDEKRLSWWLLQTQAGQMTVERHLQYDAPGSGSVVVDNGAAGDITQAGAHLFVTSRRGKLYHSDDEGQIWSLIMSIAAGVSLVAKCIEDDGSAIYHLVKSADDELQRIIVRRNESDWVADEPEAVTGLPAGTRRPGAAHKSGTTIILSATSDGGVFAATSQDDMLTWTVNP